MHVSGSAYYDWKKIGPKSIDSQTWHLHQRMKTHTLHNPGKAWAVEEW